MEGLWQVAALLLELAFDSTIKVHKQSQALMTLQHLYANKTLVAECSREEVTSLKQDLYNRVMKVGVVPWEGCVGESLCWRILFQQYFMCIIYLLFTVDETFQGQKEKENKISLFTTTIIKASTNKQPKKGIILDEDTSS